MAGALGGVPPGEEFPHPISMPGHLGPPPRTRATILPLEFPHALTHKKAMEALGPSCVAQVLRPEEQAVGASETSNPPGRRHGCWRHQHGLAQEIYFPCVWSQAEASWGNFNQYPL